MFKVAVLLLDIEAIGRFTSSTSKETRLTSISFQLADVHLYNSYNDVRPTDIFQIQVSQYDIRAVMPVIEPIAIPPTDLKNI